MGTGSGKITKDQGIRVTYSVVISWITIGAFMWTIGKPILVSAVSDAMAEEIQETVKGEVEPVVNAFQVLLTLDINNKRKEIAAYEFRQRQGVDWTADDADMLAEAEIELEALQMALQALQETG